MPKVDREKAPRSERQAYPGALIHRTDGCWKTRLGDQLGLTQIGVGEVELAPGSATGLLHWHLDEDEFIYVLSGEVTLVEESGETILRPGDCAGWRAGVPVGHTIENRTAEPARILEIGPRTAPEDTAYYVNLDMQYRRVDRRISFHTRDGTPLSPEATVAPFDDGRPEDRTG
ncbi:MAG: cupin domain-containing protein [Pseudomonadota bacterium]